MDSGPRTPDLHQVAASPRGTTPATFGVVGVLSGAAFIALFLWLSRFGSTVPWLDTHLHAWVIAHRSPWSLTIAQGITWAGAVLLVLPLVVIIGTFANPPTNSFPKRLRAGLLVGASAGVGIYLGLQMNSWTGRIRPPAGDWASVAGGPAFPSGHTTAASIVAATCAWVIAARVTKSWQRVLVWLGAVAVALAVGWSRVWLGVHWPTDVLGGWLWGIAWFGSATAAILLLRQWSDRRRARRPAPDLQLDPARRS
jgi:undecaprenyl-diphosphatase